MNGAVPAPFANLRAADPPMASAAGGSAVPPPVAAAATMPPWPGHAQAVGVQERWPVDVEHVRDRVDRVGDW